MERKPITSSTIRSVGYDAETQTLEIEFTTGRVYQYFKVPGDVYEDLIHAESHGKFFNTEIREGYAYRQIEAS